MPARVNLWILTVPVDGHLADGLGDMLGANAVSLTILAPPRQKGATVEAIFDYEPQTEDVEALLSIFASLNDILVPTYDLRPSPPLDWLKKVAEDFPPLSIARWTVHGAMHRDKVPSRLSSLQIDATNAFGTGEHPTTRGCLMMLDRILKRGFTPTRVADIGCGSGILAMACIQSCRRGLAVGIDMDAESVEIARNNIRSNGLSGRIFACKGRGYASSLIKQHAPYDLVLANIFARPLSHLAKDLRRNLRPGGIAILSGLLNSQANLVIATHQMQGLALIEHMKIGEWSILALRGGRRAI